tara:strand:- start:2402 stop:2851 length:450 start_codon:yes stop_codon:yes gene_type:complete
VATDGLEAVTHTTSRERAEAALTALSGASASFTVPGPPQGKQRPRFNRKTGNVFTPKATVAYEQAVASHCIAAKCHRRMDQTTLWTVRVQVFFGDRRRRDVDNVAKSILDALNKVVYWDDHQVSTLVVQRMEVDRDNPRVEVTLSPEAE